MAHDRTERFPKLIIQTPAEIGPGTYEITDLYRPRKHLAEVYPFLCGAKRKTIAVSTYAERLPGPGSYCIKEPQQHIPERVSIDFTDSRFKEKIYEGPSPAKYDLAENLLKPQKLRSHPGTWRGRAGKLWLTRPPRSLLPSSTSVPAKHDTGYDLNVYGVLVKNPPLKHEPPFLYNIPRGEINTTTLMYKGNFWSRMTGRIEPKPFLTPGPGHYEYERKRTATEIHDEKIREAKRMSSKQLRYLDIMYRRKMRENLPAPNRYRVKGSFDRFLKSSCKCDPYALEPPPFGQTGKRFDDKDRSGIPGPGTHNPQDQTKCVASIFLAPFGSFAGRFKKSPEDTGPGASDYHSNVGNLAYESQKRFKYSYMRTKQCIYLSKIYLFDDDDDYEIPNFLEKTEVKKLPMYHAAFKSRTERFSRPEKADNPDPGAYEVLTAFKVNRDRCDVLCRRLAPPFGTRSCRSSKKSRVDRDHMPDPTYYEVAGDISRNIKGGTMPRSRIPEEKPRAPSPARYCIHPYISSSVLKKSFNAMLGKPKVIAKLLKQEKPVKPRCPCTKKKLRWFAVGPKEYKHCRTVCL